MSELDTLADELCLMARLVRDYDYKEISRMLRRAADAIDGLRDSLNEVADKWASEKIKAEDYARENMILKANNGSRWHELFGTPERAARTMVDMCEGGTFDDCGGCPAALAECKLGDYDALLEWLRGDAE